MVDTAGLPDIRFDIMIDGCRTNKFSTFTRVLSTNGFPGLGSNLVPEIRNEGRVGDDRVELEPTPQLVVETDGLGLVEVHRTHRRVDAAATRYNVFGIGFGPEEGSADVLRLGLKIRRKPDRLFSKWHLVLGVHVKTTEKFQQKNNFLHLCLKTKRILVSMNSKFAKVQRYCVSENIKIC